MLRVMLQKIWHKKWLSVCLLLGCVLLVATAVSYPMYRNAAFDRMLQDEFSQALEENSAWPSVLEASVISKKDPGGEKLTQMEGFYSRIYDALGVTEKRTLLFYRLLSAKARTSLMRADEAGIDVRLGYLSDLPGHAELLSGKLYSEQGMTENGEIEVVISQEAMLEMDLIVGETITFDNLKNQAGEPVRLKVIGVFADNGAEDFYWQVDPASLENTCLMQEELFRSLFLGERAEKYSVAAVYYALFEYKDISAAQSDQLENKTNALLTESAYQDVLKTPEYLSILPQYDAKKDRIEATLFILQVPVLLLLCAFLFMLSGQMYELERNEISVMKSRGASGWQIFRIYLYQSTLLALLGLAAGVPLGAVFCRILGSADNFLEFGIRRQLTINYSPDIVYYAVGAVVMAILSTTVPAIRHSRVTIVHLKQQKAMKKRSLWEKCFLDLIFLGISLYGFYNYRSHTDELTQNVLAGESIDPLLYISSTLFILGAGMLLLRLQPVLVTLIFRLGRKRWKPASYASFLEIIKNGRRQQFIMLFMILTISLGMFNAVTARTILQNSIVNQSYLDGADRVLQEIWTDNSMMVKMGLAEEFRYNEPDYARYRTMSGAASYTRVLLDTKGTVTLPDQTACPVTLMGIHTREFGENTMVPDEYLSKAYYAYLNELAVEPEGVLVSANFRNVLGYHAGDKIVYKNSDGTSARGTIVDFVDYWPAYIPVTTTQNEDHTITKTEQYLVIGHLTVMQQFFGITPYQVWITVKEDAAADFMYDWLQAEKVDLSLYVDRDHDLQNTIEDPLIQGTNGVLTMSFIVTLILCAVGYLIYWIMSIRSREMMFGVLRAFGMHKGEILHMLVIEQIFSGFYAILAGLGIGRAASMMFVPMIQTAYAAANQVLPMQMITRQSDMVRLYGVVTAVMIICLTTLAALVFKLNVVKALKLGEE